MLPIEINRVMVIRLQRHTVIRLIPGDDDLVLVGLDDDLVAGIHLAFKYLAVLVLVEDVDVARLMSGEAQPAGAFLLEVRCRRDRGPALTPGREAEQQGDQQRSGETACNAHVGLQAPVTNSSIPLGQHQPRMALVFTFFTRVAYRPDALVID